MAGRNHIPLSGSKHPSDRRRADDSADLRPRRRLTPTDILLIEDRIAAQSREIQTLILDNQRLAATLVALKKDVVAAQKDLHRLSVKAASIKAERDAQVRDVYQRSLNLEAEARSIDGLSAELNRVRAEIKDLRADNDQLSEKLKETEGDIARTRPELQEFSELKTDIEALHTEIRKGRAAVEYERKMHSTNNELSEVMEKRLIVMAREVEKLRSELASAEKRAMAAIIGAGTAADPGPGYAIHQRTLEPGFGENSLSDHHAVHQVNFDAGMIYSYGGGPNIPHGRDCSAPKRTRWGASYLETTRNCTTFRTRMRKLIYRIIQTRASSITDTSTDASIDASCKESKRIRNTFFLNRVRICC